ncbi:MAG TPA: RNA polymerase sigma factor [Chitinophagales bacterium]|nr:RNA polymerase sigma factor [Chitinophagales bacterium]
MTPSIKFGTEIMQYENILRPFAFNLTRSHEESEDLIQDTFYRALANKEKFAEGTNIKAWLFTIMRNIFINNYRRNQKRNTVTDTSENQYLLNSTKSVEKNDSERVFMAEDIEKAMEDVSKDFTEPFLMYFQGFKYQEIADKLELPLGTVKSRIFFARKELQERLKNMGIVNSAYQNN